MMADSEPVAFIVGADPEKKIVIFQFSRAIARLELGPDEAMEIASNIVSRASIASGISIQEMVNKRSALVAATKKPSAVGVQRGFSDDYGEMEGMPPEGTPV